MSEVTRWYPSKIDWWIALLLAFAPVMCAVAAVGTLLAGAGGAGAAVALGGAAFLAAIYLGLVFPMRYGITDESIVVRHGLVRQKIPLRDITEVYPTHNPLSAPALSLDRLYIRFGEGFFKAAMISPADKEGFLAELAARAGLSRDGERLTRV
jgi:hypothetical protein